MIKKISSLKKIALITQKGKETTFKRRKITDSVLKINNIKNLGDLYNFIRMLDAPGYPNAYIDFNKFIFSFNNVKMLNKKIIANVEIKKK